MEPQHGYRREGRQTSAYSEQYFKSAPGQPGVAGEWSEPDVPSGQYWAQGAPQVNSPGAPQQGPSMPPNVLVPPNVQPGSPYAAYQPFGAYGARPVAYAPYSFPGQRAGNNVVMQTYGARPSGGVPEGADRIDLVPRDGASVVFCIVACIAALLGSITGGVGASALRGKLLYAMVILVVGTIGAVGMVAKGAPLLRDARATRRGWRIGGFGRMAVVITAVLLIAGLVLGFFAVSDYSTGPVTETVTFVEEGSLRSTTGRRDPDDYRPGHHHRSRQTAEYYEFRTDSGRTFRISLPNGYGDLMPEGLEPGQRVRLTYYPRTGILVPDPAPVIV